jgi:hypothetical protein
MARPEDFEDAAIATDAPAERRIKGDVKLVEALGSDLMVHFRSMPRRSTRVTLTPQRKNSAKAPPTLSPASARVQRCTTMNPSRSPSALTTFTSSTPRPTNASAECAPTHPRRRSRPANRSMAVAGRRAFDRRPALHELGNPRRACASFCCAVCVRCVRWACQVRRARPPCSCVNARRGRQQLGAHMKP